MENFINVLYLLALASAAEWNYDPTGPNGPSNWKKFGDCNLTRQSPINIDTTTVQYKSSLKPLQLGNYKNTAQLLNISFELYNNGHALQVNLLRNDKGDLNPIVTVYDGISYSLAQFHFHWGKDNSNGGEHTVDGKEYPAEVHFVHYNTKYLSLRAAADKSDGLLVWGTLIKVGEQHQGFNKILNFVDQVKYKGEKDLLTPFPLTEIVPAASVGDYYTYDGSLTTPPCYQSVKWIVNREFITVSAAQMDKFRTLRSTINATNEAEISGNYRPPQPFNERKVYRSFDTNSSGGGFFVASVFSLLCPLLIAFVRL